MHFDFADERMHFTLTIVFIANPVVIFNGNLPFM